MECKFCKKILKNQYTLSNHQKTAKFCLKKQGITLTPKFKCEGCEVIFSQKAHLQTHKQRCNVIAYLCKEDEEKEELKQSLQRLEISYAEMKQRMFNYKEKWEESLDTIQKLENKLEEENIDYKTLATEIAKNKVSGGNTYNTKITNNNYIEKLQIISPQEFVKNAEKLNMDYIRNGVNGYVDHALLTFNGKLACVDFARKKFLYKDENDEIKEDMDLDKLSVKYFCSIADRNSDLLIDEVERNSDNKMDPMEQIKRQSEYMELLSSVRKLSDTSSSGKAKEGEFYSKFKKGMAKKTKISG